MTGTGHTRKETIPPKLLATLEATDISPEETHPGVTAIFLSHLSALSYGASILEATHNGATWRLSTGVAIGSIAAVGAIRNCRAGNRAAIEEYNRRQTDGGQIL